MPAGADTLLGTTIGSWRVARLLGAGGMGRVYAAVQPQIGARVAIKVLKREMAADELVVERFFNEARAVNLIKHEAIVDVIDLGQLPDGAPYIVMEFLEGASLGTILRREKKVAQGTLARIVGEVLAALEAAHGKGIIHRDLKPDNVFVSPGGRVTVLDFGIAKLAARDGSVGSTQTNSLLGTPAYMAPEQARSQPLDARADLYAIGVMLYEAATGSLPFRGGNVFDLLQQHVSVAPEAPSQRAPEITPAFDTLILRALAKDPGDRFASAAQMRDALAAAAEGMPYVALSAGAFGVAHETKPRSDAFAATAAAASDATHATGAASGATQATAAPSAPARASAERAAAASHASHGHRETIESLARGETLPAESVKPASPAAPATVQISKRMLVGLLGGAALLGLGGAALMMVLGGRDESGTAKQTAQTDLPPQPGVQPQWGPQPQPGMQPQPQPGAQPQPTIEQPPRGPHQGKLDTKHIDEANRSKAAHDAGTSSTAATSPTTTSSTSTTTSPTSTTAPTSSTSSPPKPPAPTMTKAAQSKVVAGPVDHVRSIVLNKPSAFDPFAYWSEAEKIAQDMFGSTNVYRGKATFRGIKRDGTMDIESGKAMAQYHFLSRDRTKAGDLSCIAQVMIQMDAAGQPSAAIHTATDIGGCKQRATPLFQCSMSELWAKATAMGAPAEGVALLNRISSSTWQFTIEKPTAWSEPVPDDCKTATP
jgi:hypothetical protein